MRNSLLYIISTVTLEFNNGCGSIKRADIFIKFLQTSLQFKPSTRAIVNGFDDIKLLWNLSHIRVNKTNQAHDDHFSDFQILNSFKISTSKTVRGTSKH